MLTLGIETSVRPGSVALCDKSSCLLQLPLERPDRRHAQMLASQVQQLFQQIDKPIQTCDLIAVSLGPGSFTGLRVGIVFAKTLAYARGCDVIGVDTFASIATSSLLGGSEITVIANAFRQELFVGHYQADQSSEESRRSVWSRRGEITIEPARDWLRGLKADQAVTGPGLELFEEYPADCRIEAVSHRNPQAAGIAQLGWELYQQRGPDDIFRLQPAYLRRSAAEEKWEAKIASSEPNP